jgi:hypothetical protein
VEGVVMVMMMMMMVMMMLLLEFSCVDFAVEVDVSVVKEIDVYLGRWWKPR